MNPSYRFSLKQVVLACASVAVLAGCDTMTPEQRGATTGAVIGAVAGQVVGGNTRGTAIGAALGGLGGYVWSRQMEEKKRQMERATAGTGTVVTQTADNQLKLHIPSDVSFAVGRADIQPNFRPILDTFAQGMLRNPQARVRIIGHTDSTGTDAINNPLSINRAASVRDYLVARGVPMGAISIDGRGAREPVASNDTAAGRAQNRRVEMFMAEAAR